MRFLRFLFFGRWRRTEPAPIREQEAYAHSYGDRSGEVLSVVRMPEPEPEPEPEPQLQPVPEPMPRPVRIVRRTSDLTGELLRRAFEARLDARHKAAS